MTSAGLCETCRHKSVITSDRGSVFLRCELSKTDGRYPKYPSLPVLRCDGYAAVESSEPF